MLVALPLLRGVEARLGSGRIIISEIDVANMFSNMV
jgi:hypothetical protein